MRIVYKTEKGGVAVVIPTPEALETMTIEEIATKDVPTGAEYLIVEDSEVPSDRTYRNAWKLKSKKIVVDDILKAKVQSELDRIANMPTIESLALKLDKLEKKLK